MFESVYEFKVKDANGNEVSLEHFRGKPLLIVNTASECGFTPQYEGLETLQHEYGPKGFSVLGFPCNQFGAQESGTNEEIAAFCKSNYKVTFPVFDKVRVNGANTEPLYDFLKENAPGFMGTSFIKWNFTKFLIDRDGQPVARFSPQTDPLTLKPEIERLLG